MTTITIHGVEMAELDMLDKAIQRAVTLFTDSDRHIDIYVSERIPADAAPYMTPGWLEYMICYRQDVASPAFFTLGMIQREIGEPVEFHS